MEGSSVVHLQPAFHVLMKTFEFWIDSLWPMCQKRLQVWNHDTAAANRVQ